MSLILGLTACTKEAVDNGVAAPEQNIITHTVAISEDAWGEEVRSSYEPGVGISLDGTESVSVFYDTVTADSKEDGSNHTFEATPVAGTNNGDGTFTFSHTGSAEETYNYYFVVPHVSNSTKNNEGDASYHRLSRVQKPSASSFDPSFDYLIGRPALGILGNSTTTELTKFKRLFAPFCITINDDPENPLFEGEKIREVNLTFSEAATKTQLLTGIFYLNHSTDYSSAKISSWYHESDERSAASNSITASYPDGLEQSGSWETWFMINATEVPACDMTLTITTDNQRISRTVTLSNALNFEADKINRMTFTMKAEGRTAAVKSGTIDFSNLSATTVPSSLALSNGVSLNWETSACQMSKSTGMGMSLQLNKGGSFTLPAIPNVTYKRIYLTENASNGTQEYTISALNGETSLANGSFNHYNANLRNNGGILTLDLGEGVSGAITIKRTDAIENNYCRISRITVEYEGEAAIDNTYYARWERGEDIVIGDLTVNKTNYPEAVKVGISELTNKHFTNGGLIFIDGEGSYTMTASPSMLNECIVIGNDPSYQPSIIMKGGSDLFYFAIRGETNFVFKNLNLNGEGNNYLWANTDKEGTSGKGNLYIEDCTISTNGNMVSDYNSTATLAKVYINNCVIDFSTSSTGKAVYGFITKKPNKDGSALLSVTLTNNVVYTTTPLNNYLVMIGGNKTAADQFTAYVTQNADVVVSNNTTYGLYHSNGMVSVYSAKSVVANNNLHYFDNSTLLKTGYSIGYFKSDDTTTCKVRNTAAYTNNDGEQYWKPFKKPSGSTITENIGSNLFKLTATPFTTVNTTIGYFPVDTSVVTNGAGATYETKLWYNWGE